MSKDNSKKKQNQAGEPNLADLNADQLNSLMQLLQLRNGIVPQHKDMKEYKFWKTQPVKKFDETFEKEGPIDPPRTPAEISDKPLPLLSSFEWVDIDVNNDKELEEVYVLLNGNYVEDKDSTFRFNYTKEFFQWCLKSPGWRQDWHVGVRVRESKKLVAFIAAIPSTLQIRGTTLKSVEINFLCVHKQLRSKRLAPVLIKEITRRVNKQDIWFALYTAGVVLPSPVSTCRYTHRPINWPKLCDVGFAELPPNTTKHDIVAHYAVPSKTKTQGSRPMKLEDVDQVLELFNKYQSRFDLIQIFSREEFAHWFLGSDDIIHSYVVETTDPKNGKRITDFFSFYSLSFTVLDNKLHDMINIGYLYYYASDADFKWKDRFNKDATAALRKRLNFLMHDAVVLAKNMNIDVFNALTSQDNALFLQDQKFGPGDGFLNFYLFNYNAFPITSGLLEDTLTYDTEKRSNIGVVML